MSTITRKIASVGLSLVTAASLSGVMSLPVASAQSTADLAAQLAQLLQQIQALQAQLNQGQGGGAPSSYNFARDLTVGSRGDDVKALQQWLNANGYQVAASGPGSPGNESTYFGPATKAALAKFQKAKGISPAAGYFGPKTRAALAASGGVQVGGGGVGAAPTGVVSVYGAGLQGGSLINGSAQNPVHTVRISNGTGADVWVTGLTYKKVGVVSDTNITNAYISVGNEIVAQYLSLSGGTLAFSGNLVVVPAGQSKDITLRVDVSGATTGNTIAFNLDAVTLSNGQVSGGLPINGPTFTVTSVSNPSLAQVSSLSYVAVTNQVDAGTNGVRVSAQTLTIQNSAVKLLSARYTVTGAINLTSDLRNLSLRVDGTEVATVSAPDASGRVFFNIPNGAVLSTGSHLVEVYADVLGTPNRTFKVEILRPYDLVGVDTQYNTNINFGTPTGTATTVSVRAGTITVSLATDSPTGNVAKGQSNVVLLKAKFFAAGEAVRIKSLPFKLTFNSGSGVNSGNIDNQVRNIAVYDDVGNQVGTTINQLSVSSACGGSAATFGTDTVDCSFGSSNSNINYVIPANATRVLTLRLDLQTTATITSIRADFTAGSNNAEGQNSFQTASTGAVNGSVLSVASTPFSGALNSAVGTQTYVRGTTQARLASFSLSASSAEGIKVSSLTFNVNDGAGGANLKLQNLYVKAGGAQFGLTVNSVDTNNQTYTFAGSSPFTISAGGSVIVDVYADILSSSATGTYPAVVDLTGATAVGATSNSNQTLSPASTNGQDVTVSGSGTLTVGVDSANPPARQIVMGSSQVEVARFRFTADNNEDIKITDLRVTASSTTSTAPATFSNLSIYEVGGTGVSLGSGTALSGSNGLFTTDFHFANPLVVSKNTTKTYVVKADVANYTSSPNSHNKSYIFKIAANSHVTAIGVGSNQSATVTGAAVAANTQTVLRTKLTVSGFSALGAGTGRVRSAADDVASLNLAADSAYGAEFVSLTLTFSGSAPTSTFAVTLLDSSNNAVANGTTSSGSVTLTLSPARLITAGGSETFKVRINSSDFNNNANTSDSMSVQIQNAGDLGWREQGGSTTLGLESTVVPLTVTVSYE